MSAASQSRSQLLKQVLSEHSQLYSSGQRALKFALDIEESSINDKSTALTYYHNCVRDWRRATRLHRLKEACEFERKSNYNDSEAEQRQAQMLKLLPQAEDRLRAIETKCHNSSATSTAAALNSSAGGGLMSRLSSLFSLSGGSTDAGPSAVNQPHIIDLTDTSSRQSTVSHGQQQQQQQQQPQPLNKADKHRLSETSVLPLRAPDSSLSAAKSRLPQRPMSAEEKALNHRILDELLSDVQDVRWDDVAGLDAAKAALKEMVIMPLLRPDIFQGLRSPARGLLLFGPPGNGKTQLARAVAAQANAFFFNVSASTLTSKWHGEAEKMVKALFRMARELSSDHKGAVIFIDEIDSLLSERGGGNEHEASRRLKTQFLVELDGAATGEGTDRVVLLAATNRPQDLDEAVLRRFPRRILVPLPDAATRLSMLQAQIKNQHSAQATPTIVSLDDCEMQRIAELTEGYSGADIRSVVRDAAMVPVRELDIDVLQKVAVHDLRPVTFQDFKHALERVRPSVDPEQQHALEDWNLKFGSL